MLRGFCAMFQSGDRKVINNQFERQVDADFEDQYSTPGCRSLMASPGVNELDPNTSQMLGVLQLMEIAEL